MNRHPSQDYPRVYVQPKLYKKLKESAKKEKRTIQAQLAIILETLWNKDKS